MRRESGPLHLLAYSFQPFRDAITSAFFQSLVWVCTGVWSVYLWLLGNQDMWGTRVKHSLAPGPILSSKEKTGRVPCPNRMITLSSGYSFKQGFVWRHSSLQSMFTAKLCQPIWAQSAGLFHCCVGVWAQAGPRASMLSAATLKGCHMLPVVHLLSCTERNAGGSCYHARTVIAPGFLHPSPPWSLLLRLVIFWSVGAKFCLD